MGRVARQCAELSPLLETIPVSVVLNDRTAWPRFAAGPPAWTVPGHNPRMLFAAVTLSAFALAVPPPDAGPWKQIGAAVTSRPGKLAHFFRATMQPTALAVVARSSSAKPIRLTWFGYCEFESDDGMTEQRQATVTGVHRVVAYPPVLTGATDCTVVVTMRVSGGRATSAVFAY